MLMDMEIRHFIIYREDILECLREEAEAARLREEEQAKVMAQRMRARRGGKRR